MRPIDADALLAEAKQLSWPFTGDGWDNFGVYELIERQPTLSEWVLTSERPPELPCKDDWCCVTVLAVLPGRTCSWPMYYAREKVRGKWVERWKWIWDTICDETPVCWMPLPKPPETV